MHLWNSQKIDHMIIEADGAAGRPIKAPRENEPVIASGTTLVVAILGVDGLGKDLTEVHAFRADRVSELTGIPIGGRITAEAMALLVIHPEGLFKGAPASSRVVVFLNKVNIPQGLKRAKEIAQKIVERRHRQIERIILGQLKAEAPVAEVILRLE
jgi:probable selenium-dependent hydroxylase accessory protein YqeC